MRINENFDLDKLFFTSDCHFFHDAIRWMCERPFESNEEQTEILIQNWNEIVPKDGIVFEAGDMAFTGNIDLVQRLISKLNGKIYHIMGNHCYQNKWDRQVIKDIFDNRVMDVANVLLKQDNNKHLFISHYPQLFWPRDSIMLHGHIHSGPNSKASEKAPFHAMRYDIGIDNNNYYPISYEELDNIITNQKLRENE